MVTKKSDNAAPAEKHMRGYIISNIVLAASVILCLVITVISLTQGYVSIFGYSMFRVVTGSMEPTVPVGAVVLCKDVDIDEIKLDDIICFRSRESDHYGVTVTHRVVSVEESDDGNTLLETRGDANYTSDAYYVNEMNLIGNVIWYSGKESIITNMLSFITGKIGFLACIVFPVVLVSGLILQGAVKSLKKDMDTALYELSRMESKGDPVENERGLLPGYKTLTVADYNEIYNTLKQELLEELKNRVEEADSKTE